MELLISSVPSESTREQDPPTRFGRAVLASGMLLFTTAVLVSALSWEFVDLQADETVIAWAGKQVSAGRVPYSDFFIFLPPLIPYGLGFVARTLGPGITPLRILTLIWVLGTTFSVFSILIRRGSRPVWAAAVALLVPTLLFCVWPLPSHYWFAVGFMGAAGLTVSTGPLTASRMLVAGCLMGLAGLCVQSAGAFLILLVVSLMAVGWRPPALVAAYGAFGIALPLLFCAGLLASNGTLADAFNHVIVWPVTEYRTLGNVNDVALFDVMNQTPTRLTATIRGSDRMSGQFLLLIWLAGGCVVIAGLIDKINGSHSKRIGLDTPIFAASLVVFLLGRHDWQHLSVWTAPILLILGRGIEDMASYRLRLLSRSVVAASLIFVSAQFAILWSSRPPSVGEVLTADAQHDSEVRRELLERMPRVLEDSLPVLYLSWAGSMFYLVWAPIPPPLDWVHAPSTRFNSANQFADLAEFVRANNVRYIVLAWREHSQFINDDSPIGSLIAHDFEFYTGTLMGAVYMRRGLGTAREVDQATRMPESPAE